MRSTTLTQPIVRTDDDDTFVMEWTTESGSHYLFTSPVCETWGTLICVAGTFAGSAYVVRSTDVFVQITDLPTGHRPTLTCRTGPPMYLTPTDRIHYSSVNYWRD